MLDKFAQSRCSRTADEVLATAIPATQVGVRQKAKAIASRVRETEPGKWITWTAYPAEQRRRASVATQDLRNSRVRTLAAKAGPAESRAADGGGSLLVQVTRIPASPGAS